MLYSQYEDENNFINDQLSKLPVFIFKQKIANKFEDPKTKRIIIFAFLVILFSLISPKLTFAAEITRKTANQILNVDGDSNDLVLYIKSFRSKKAWQKFFAGEVNPITIKIVQALAISGSTSLLTYVLFHNLNQQKLAIANTILLSQQDQCRSNAKLDELVTRYVVQDLKNKTLNVVKENAILKSESLGLKNLLDLCLLQAASQIVNKNSNEDLNLIVQENLTKIFVANISKKVQYRDLFFQPDY